MNVTDLTLMVDKDNLTLESARAIIKLAYLKGQQSMKEEGWKSPEETIALVHAHEKLAMEIVAEAVGAERERIIKRIKKQGHWSTERGEFDFYPVYDSVLEALSQGKELT